MSFLTCWVELLQTYNPLENLYLGYTIGHLHESIREHLKSIGLHKSKKLQNLLKISNGDTLRLKGLLSPKLINDHDNTFRFSLGTRRCRLYFD